MKKRNCPVCGSNKNNLLMKFSPELLSAVNSTYKEEILKEILNGQEKLLTYSQCENCEMVYCENVFDDDILKKVYTQTIDHNKSKSKTLSITGFGILLITVNLIIIRMNCDNSISKLSTILLSIEKVFT